MLKPNEKKLARRWIADFCRRAEINQIRWHYTRSRPFRGFGVEPEEPHANDCSGYIALVFNYAMHEAQVFMADPLGERYSGWGWTGSLYEWCKVRATHAPTGKYLVGDIAIYDPFGDSGHTTICRKAGSGKTAIFSSNGREAAPNKTSLHYRGDLAGVWRHPALR